MVAETKLAKRRNGRRNKKIQSGPMRRVLSGHLNRMHYVPPIRDSRSMLERIQSWVYVAMERNATEVSRGTLRLYHPDKKKTNGYKIRPLNTTRLSYLKGVNRLASEQAVEIETHPLLRVMAAPTPLLDCCSFLWLVTAYLQLFGEAFVYKGRGSRGEVKELWPLPNHWVRMILGPENVIDFYEFRHGGAYERFPAEDVVHIRKPSPIDMVAALGPLKGILQAAETNLRFAEWQNAFFQNYAVPDILLIPDDEQVSQPQVETLITDWEASHGGWRRRGKVDIMPFNVKVERLGMSMKEIRSKETLDGIKNEILSGFGVPPQVITTDGATFNNLRQGLQLWQRNTIGSYQVVIASALNRQLLPEWFEVANPIDPPAFLAFDNPVSEDKQTDTELRILRIKGGLASTNEGRAEEGSDPVEGGDEVRIESGLVRLNDPTAAELQMAQIEATASLQQAQVDLQREQAMASREDATAAAAVSADSAAAPPQVTFAELTSAATGLAQVGDLDALNMVRASMAQRLGATLTPLTQIAAASSAAVVDDNKQEDPADEQGKPNEETEAEDNGAKPPKKPADEGGDGDGEDRKPPRKQAGELGGYNPGKPREFPTAVLKRIVELETKLELGDVDQPPQTLEAVLRGLFERMEAEVRENLPTVATEG